MTASPVEHYVLLLQEALVRDGRPDAPGQPDLDALARQRGLHVFHLPIFTGGPRPRGTAILSTSPLESPNAIDLPQERQHRVAAAASVSIAGERLIVVSAHLENRLALLRGGPFGDRARGRQARALVEALPDGAHAIVGGDMNTMLGRDEPAWRLLTARFSDTPVERSQPTFRGRLVLDHLFFDVPDGWSVRRRVVPNRYGSDHHPVLGLVERSAV